MARVAISVGEVVVELEDEDRGAPKLGRLAIRLLLDAAMAIGLAVEPEDGEDDDG